MPERQPALAPPPVAAPRPPGGRRRVPNPKLTISAAVVALSLVYLVVVGFQSASVYYVKPGELEAQAASVSNRLVRVGGRVVDGSIERDDRTLTLRFAIRDRDGSASLPVVYRGVIPDLFGYAKDGYYQDVVVEGRYTAAGILEAQQLLVSHGALQEADAQTGGGGAPRPAATSP